MRSENAETDDSWLNAMEMTELTSQRVNELLQENYSLKSRLCDMETRLDIIAKSQRDLMDAVLRKRKQSKAESSRASTQSLPEADDARTTKAIGFAGPDVTSITDQILLCPYPDRNKSASPLLSHLRMDQTLRKYDETRYQPSALSRRPRLNSSSLSISQDMRDMDRSHRAASDVVTSDEDVPSVVVHEPWEDSS
ncbi:hypothetical protein OESDEN_13090 [Oesophagostomum dentatum]|uniref:Uncharacterized protein n=1 Tax=Oesophagostomum dentatum TaxID=61180 RepID=A0A0B1SVG1_OESDE|nr:hypothetical protein OESDEN_13090 [Oesophagostomum dentatum]